MSTPVVMPQMGESIAEGTIVRWIKKVGDSVDRDEPLFEISTDKVDAEIPSPAAGTLLEITVKEGETVAGQQRGGDDRRGRRSRAAGRRGADGAAGAKGAEVRARCQGAGAGADAVPVPARPRRPSSADATGTPGATGASPASPPRLPRRPRPSHLQRPPLHRLQSPMTGFDRQKSSPLVRRIAKEHGVDIRPHRRHRHRRPRHQAGHPRLSGSTAAPAQLASAASSAPLQHAARLQRRATAAGDRSRADVGDAQEDRRAHGAQPAHLGARVLGVRGQLQPRRRDPQGEEGRVRAARRQAHVHVVHRQGRGRLPAPPSR